jgi:Holliday junction resolvase YEN1
LRIAIDISIWLFQIQSGKGTFLQSYATLKYTDRRTIGGTNPALRTFYYRLLRLISLSIHPLFVFDGPNKPPFKRNKRSGPNVSSIPEFLAKQLLKQFGLPFHIAPGEAEAECALLQQEKLVDAVLSEDVDTLMFGSGITLRNWTPEVNKNGTPTHVNVYDATLTKTGSGLDREGMILIALMSGGDYIPEGIPGCGPKTACEAARAGFGTDLCKISRKDKTSLKVWRERLEYELKTNESKFFKRKHGALEIPEDFPNPEVLGYYTHPCISPPDKVIRLRNSLSWDQDLNFAELRTFTGEAFDWTKLGGAKKFIRNLAPALLVRELRLRSEVETTDTSDNIADVAKREDQLINAIHGKRNHASTDMVTELRISFTPHTLVPIDLDVEEPDDENPVDSGDEVGEDDNEEAAEAPTSPSKRRGPSTYDPTVMEKLWISETYLKIGVPLKVQDWEESLRNPRKCNTQKHTSNEETARASKPRKKPTKTTKSTMPPGALDRYTRVTKPGQHLSLRSDRSKTSDMPSEISNSTQIQPAHLPIPKPSNFRVAPPFPSSTLMTASTDVINLLSSPPAAQIHSRATHLPTLSPQLGYELPSTITKRRRSPLRRTQTDTAILDLTGSSRPRPTTPPGLGRFGILDSPSSLPSPSQLFPAKKARKTVATKPLSKRLKESSKSQNNVPSATSSPARQTDITAFFPKSKHHQSIEPPQWKFPPVVVKELDLTESSHQPSSSLYQDNPEPSSQEIPAENSRSGLIELHSNVVESQSQERLSKATSEEGSKVSKAQQMPPTCQEVEPLDLTGEDQVPQKISANSGRTMGVTHPVERRSPRAHITSTISSAESRPARSKQTLKEVIRVRESLDGAFTIEQIDLSGDGDANMARTHVAAIGSRKLFRMSEVSVLDLTGD